jgi:hypothetical protein
MDVKTACKNYFNMFQEISSKNKTTTKLLASAKILSLITVIVPLAFGIAYVVSSLLGRVNKKDKLNSQEIQVDDLAKDTLRSREKSGIRENHVSTAKETLKAPEELKKQIAALTTAFDSLNQTRRSSIVDQLAQLDIRVLITALNEYALTLDMEREIRFSFPNSLNNGNMERRIVPIQTILSAHLNHNRSSSLQTAVNAIQQRGAAALKEDQDFACVGQQILDYLRTLPLPEPDGLTVTVCAEAEGNQTIHLDPTLDVQPRTPAGKADHLARALTGVALDFRKPSPYACNSAQAILAVITALRTYAARQDLSEKVAISFEVIGGQEPAMRSIRQIFDAALGFPADFGFTNMITMIEEKGDRASAEEKQLADVAREVLVFLEELL